MRIAHVLWGLGPGGIETMITEIVGEQAKEHKVALFVINDYIVDFILSKVDKKVAIFRCNRKEGSKNPLSIMKLNVYLTIFRPDIIHTHSYRAINLILYPFGKRVRTIHNTNNVSSEYHRYHALISISKAVKEFTNKQGWDSYLAENGVPITRIRSVTSSKFDDGCFHFVQVGRFCIKQKGQDLLIRAINILVNEEHITNFMMHFIGNGDDEILLKNMVKEYGLEEYVVFEGLKEQSWIYENLCKYDLFIQPSRYEGFGLTVAEAVAAKVPVLVSNIEGPLEIIDGGQLGMCFENENYVDCASKLKSFLSNGKNEYMREAAYNHVIEHYNVSMTAKKYLDVYKSLF